VRLEGLGQLKNRITSSGIEPATLRFVAQCPPPPPTGQLRPEVLNVFFRLGVLTVVIVKSIPGA
jgi:hypothetical protein